MAVVCNTDTRSERTEMLPEHEGGCMSRRTVLRTPRAQALGESGAAWRDSPGCLTTELRATKTTALQPTMNEAQLLALLPAPHTSLTTNALARARATWRERRRSHDRPCVHNSAAPNEAIQVCTAAPLAVRHHEQSW